MSDTPNTDRLQALVESGALDYPTIKDYNHITMSGQEWYDRFVREYHMRADWIAGDPVMGDDAEHDVLLAARLASGIEETKEL